VTSNDNDTILKKIMSDNEGQITALIRGNDTFLNFVDNI
jgi:hypothetical protein